MIDLFSDDALSIFLDPDECGTLPNAAIRWLLERDVSIESLTTPWCVRAARVRFEPSGRYTPNLVGDFAFVFAVIGGGIGIVDAVAWSPASGQIATRFGIGAALGEGRVGRTEIGLAGSALPVHRTPLEWLRAGRRGLVIADHQRAAHVFVGVNLIAVDEAHAVDLRRRLRVQPPTIVLRQQRYAA